MASIAEQIAAKGATIIRDTNGFLWHLYPVVAGDLIQDWTAQLGAVLVSEEDAAQLQAIQEATSEEDKQELTRLLIRSRRIRSESATKQILEMRYAMIRACVRKVQAAADAEPTAILFTLDEGQRDLEANILHFSDIGADTLQLLGDAAQTITLGGPEARSRLQTFRPQ